MKKYEALAGMQLQILTRFTATDFPSLIREISKSRSSFEKMKSESERLASFRGWPVSFIDPKDCAHAGFFYKGSSDLVRTFKKSTFGTQD